MAKKKNRQATAREVDVAKDLAMVSARPLGFPPEGEPWGPEPRRKSVYNDFEVPDVRVADEVYRLMKPAVAGLLELCERRQLRLREVLLMAEGDLNCAFSEAILANTLKNWYPGWG